MKPLCIPHPSATEIKDNTPAELCHTIIPKRIEATFPTFLVTASNRPPVATVGWSLRPLIPQENGGIRELCNDVMKPRSNI